MSVLVHIYHKENPDAVKCTSCEWKGTENEILFDAGKETEHCPECKKAGTLMDIEKEAL